MTYQDFEHNRRRTAPRADISFTLTVTGCLGGAGGETKRDFEFSGVSTCVSPAGATLCIDADDFHRIAVDLPTNQLVQLKSAFAPPLAAEINGVWQTHERCFIGVRLLGGATWLIATHPDPATAGVNTDTASPRIVVSFPATHDTATPDTATLEAPIPEAAAASTTTLPAVTSSALV